MLTYNEAVVKLGNRDSKKIGNNTYLVKLGDSIAVRLHNTNVVTLHADGRYTLNASGYRTVTTKARIKKYSPAQVYAKAFAWFVGDVPFFDGIEVDLSGKVLNGDSALVRRRR